MLSTLGSTGSLHTAACKINCITQTTITPLHLLCTQVTKHGTQGGITITPLDIIPLLCLHLLLTLWINTSEDVSHVPFLALVGRRTLSASGYLLTHATLLSLVGTSLWHLQPLTCQGDTDVLVPGTVGGSQSRWHLGSHPEHHTKSSGKQISVYRLSD